jgi:hypothetical protein
MSLVFLPLLNLGWSVFVPLVTDQRGEQDTQQTQERYTIFHKAYKMNTKVPATKIDAIV